MNTNLNTTTCIGNGTVQIDKLPQRQIANKQVELAKESSRTDRFEHLERALLENEVYTKSSVSTNGVQSSNGIYDSSNYYSTSISLRQMAAQRAKITCNSSGEPIISNGSEAIAYNNSYNYLLGFTPIETYGESEALKSRSNPFGEVGTLGSVAAEKARNRAIQALQDCGLAKNESMARSMMSSDSFYEKAARVLSFMDNGITYGTPLNVNYECLDNAMPNIERWRNAVANGSQNSNDYGYRWY